jgi:hypothetical protein
VSPTRVAIRQRALIKVILERSYREGAHESLKLLASKIVSLSMGTVIGVPSKDILRTGPGEADAGRMQTEDREAGIKWLRFGCAGVQAP